MIAYDDFKYLSSDSTADRAECINYLWEQAQITALYQYEFINVMRFLGYGNAHDRVRFEDHESFQDYRNSVMNLLLLVLVAEGEEIE